MIAFLLALALPALASTPLTPPAPDFPPADVWLNAQPMTLARLKHRRALLVTFINTANINSLRALKSLKALDRQYGLSGLMVIGVHTPEFGFQRNPAEVRAALKSQGVEFPVVLDNDKALWNAYRVGGWPEFFLVDRKGRIVYDHLGEGRYSELEERVQKAIDGLDGYPPPSDQPVLADAPTFACGQATAEIDARSIRGKITDMDSEDVPDGVIITAEQQGQVFTRGRWLLGEGLRLDQRNRDRSAFARIIYVGAQALATLAPAPADGPAKFYVRQDDQWLTPAQAGADVRFDDDGRSFVVVDRAKPVELAENDGADAHELTLIPMQQGSAIYAWSFSDKCLRYQP